jgi:hypothetical protein
VRFTQGKAAVFAILLGTPKGKEVWLEASPAAAEVSLLGHGVLETAQQGDALRIAWPESRPATPAHALRLRAHE